MTLEREWEVAAGVRSPQDHVHRIEANRAGSASTYLADLPIAVMLLIGERVEFVNSEWEELSGLEESASLGSGWIAAVHSHDRDKALEIVESPSVGDRDGLVRLRSEGRQDCWARIRSRLIDPARTMRAVTVAPVGSNEQVAARLSHFATLDSLTGLMNRASFLGAVEHNLVCHAGLGAMLYIDLDRFKEVNDHLGHRFGDAVLAMACRRVQAALRNEDFAGRLGGDEIGVFCPALTSPAQVFILAERLVDVIGVAYSVGEEIVIIDASIGIAFVGSAERSLESLIDEADQAMYVAKSAGGAGWATTHGASSLHPRSSSTPADPVLDEIAEKIVRIEQLTADAVRQAAASASYELSSRLIAVRRALARARLLTCVGADVVQPTS
jgi:diguanylate cyclase (GGDEF)-like protein